MSTKHIFLRSLIAATFVLACFVSSSVQAAAITLADRNSSVDVDLALVPAVRAGASNWMVDSVNQLYQQWFWYRVGAAGPEASINTLTLVGSQATDTNFFVDPSNDTLAVRYRDAASTYTVDLTYVLRGGSAASNHSDIAETITITNTSAAPLDFHFFQYSDFDLNGASGGQTATFVSPFAFRQTGGGVVLSETVVTPPPSHHEADVYPNTLTSLDDLVATTLDDTKNTASGDATWAFQWDFTIGAGTSVGLSKDKRLDPSPIPEPASLAIWGFLAIGMAAGSRFCRRRS